jgi:tetratricopeptide (TPR) repeat protein
VASAVDSVRLDASFRATLDLLEGMECEERDTGLDGPGLPILERGMALAPWHGPLRYAAAESYFKLGNELRAAGAIDQAITRYARAVALEPEHAEANNNLGAVLAARGDLEGAVASFRRAVEVNPEFGGAHLNLGKAQLAVGDLEGAVDHCREAVRLAPELAQAHLALGAALRLRGDAEAGLAEMRTAARLDPNSPAALTAAARILATHPEAQLRDGKEAVRLARRAAKLAEEEGGGEGMRIATLETLAAAYAEAGDFDQAIATAERTRSLAAAAGANPMARDMEARLTLYRARQPLREP